MHKTVEERVLFPAMLLKLCHWSTESFSSVSRMLSQEQVRSVPFRGFIFFTKGNKMNKNGKRKGINSELSHS